MKVQKIQWIGVLFLSLIFPKLQAQTSDEKFREPIVETIKKIENKIN